MNLLLLSAALVAAIIAGVHSYLGERHIVMRLLRRPDLPHLLGSDWFTKRVLRLAWHLTSVAWLGLAAIMVLLAGQQDLDSLAIDVLAIVRWTFLVSAGATFLATRGRHLAWILFAAVAVALRVGAGS